MVIENVKECFASALKDETKGKKHKGLLKVKFDLKEAEGYIIKAKKNLELCKFYQEKGFDYKLPEEWFYTLYYCALAILSKFGVESRSQRCTALFLKYVKDEGIIKYDSEFIQRIMVYKEKEEKSDVDEREKSRYSPMIEIKEVTQNYDKMMNLCREAISQCEEIVFSEGHFNLPEEVI
ncbi:MAG: hypothetical protein AABX04_02005 [Nanoarchaeota archaeon]